MLQVILVVDDSEDDVFFLLRAFGKAGFKGIVHSLHNGLELIAYLTAQGIYIDRDKFPIPTLIFLDLQMPEMNGYQVMEWLRQKPEFSPIPVVLHSAVLMRDLLKLVVTHGVKTCLGKPPGVKAIRELSTFLGALFPLSPEPELSS